MLLQSDTKTKMPASHESTENMHLNLYYENPKGSYWSGLAKQDRHKGRIEGRCTDYWSRAHAGCRAQTHSAGFKQHLVVVPRARTHWRAWGPRGREATGASTGKQIASLVALLFGEKEEKEPLPASFILFPPQAHVRLVACVGCFSQFLCMREIQNRRSATSATRGPNARLWITIVLYVPKSVQSEYLLKALTNRNWLN